MVRQRTSHTVRSRTISYKSFARERYSVTPVTTVHQQLRAVPAANDEPDPFRQRLLDGLAASIVEDGYRNTTVAEIVRRARTSRRTFYEYFSDKEACFVALLTDANAEMIRQISAAVDQNARWTSQVRQAVEAWIACAESRPAITLSWIREVPSLGTAARRLQRDTMEAFVTMIQTLCDTDAWRAARASPVARRVSIMLTRGLRELSRHRAGPDGAPRVGVAERLDHGDEGFHRVPLQPAGRGAERWHVTDPAEGDRRPGLRAGDPCLDGLPHLAGPRCALVDRGGDLADHLRVCVGEQSDETGFLVGEVLVEGPP